QGMEAAGGNGTHSGDALHLDGRQAGCGAVVAKLAKDVVTPRPNRAIAFQGKRMETARRRRDHAGQAGDLDRGRRRNRCGDAVCKLAIRVVPPGPDGAVRLDPQGAKSTTCGSTR